MSDKPTLKIFISSPSDVEEERSIAGEVIDRLSHRFSYHIDLQSVMWESEPIRASGTFPDSIPRPSDSDIVITILWSRLGFDLPDEERFRGKDGRPLTGTEWEFMDTLRALEKTDRKHPDLLVFRKSCDPVFQYRDKEQIENCIAQKERLDNFFNQHFQDNSGSFKAALREFNDIDEFESMLIDNLRKLIEQRIKSDAKEEPRFDNWTADHGSPFRGLECFEVEDAPIFFGRVRAREELRHLLKDQIDRGRASLLIVGSSGSGKSSLARAGLLANLKKSDVIGTVSVCRHAIVRPSDASGNPLQALANLLIKETLPEICETVDGEEELVALFRDQTQSALAAIKTALDSALGASGMRSPHTARLAILIDQLEEIFTAVRGTEKDLFVKVLTELADSGFVWVLATLRQDFLHRIDKIKGLRDLFDAGQYLLKPLRSHELSQVIRKPAEYAGLRFEEDPVSGRTLANELEREAERDPRALPLLEFVLDRLFEHRSDDGILRIEDYKRMGRLSGAIVQRAAEATKHLNDIERKELREILRSLVTVTSPDAKPMATWAERARTETTDIKKQIISELLDAHLLVAGGTEKAARVRLVHEALIDNWEDLKEVSSEDRHFLQTRQELRGLARRYNVDYESSYLLTGRRLYDAKMLLEEYQNELDAEVIKFIRASLKLEEEEEQRKERQMAEEANRSKQIAETRTRLRRTKIAVLVVTSLSAALAVNEAIKARGKLNAQNAAIAAIESARDAVVQNDYDGGLANLETAAITARDSRLSNPLRAVLLTEVADSYNRISEIHPDANTFDILNAARETFQEATDLLPSSSRLIELTEIAETFADMAQENGDYGAEIEERLQAVKLRTQVAQRGTASLGCPCQIAEHQWRLAELYARQGKHRMALRSYRDAAEVYRQWTASDPEKTYIWAGLVTRLASLVQFSKQNRLHDDISKEKSELIRSTRILNNLATKSNNGNDLIWTDIATSANEATKNFNKINDYLDADKAAAQLLSGKVDLAFSVYENLLAAENLEERRKWIASLQNMLIGYMEAGHPIELEHLARLQQLEVQATDIEDEAEDEVDVEELLYMTKLPDSSETVELAFTEAADLLDIIPSVTRQKLRRNISLGMPVGDAVRKAFGVRNRDSREKAREIFCSYLPSQCR